MDNQRYINREEALQRVRGNEKTLLLMMKLFLDSKEVKKLEDSITNKNIEESEQLSHAVKGLSGNLSLPMLYEASTKLNNELRQKEFHEESIQAYREVLAETRSIIQKLFGIK